MSADRQTYPNALREEGNSGLDESTRSTRYGVVPFLSEAVLYTPIVMGVLPVSFLIDENLIDECLLDECA